MKTIIQTQSSVVVPTAARSRGLLFAALILAGTTTTSHAEVSFNVGAVSNYLFRGVTQTEDKAAIQGGIDYAAASGFYLGTWASNVDFDGAGYELDLYFGFETELDNGLGIDIGYVYYAYPDASPDNIDFGEIYASLSFGPLSGGLAYTIHSDNDDDLFDSGDLYLHAGLDFELGADLGLGFVAGYYKFKNDGKPGIGDADYWHVAASLSREFETFGEFSFNLEYADISRSDALGSSNSKDPKVWVGWTLSF
jgi:uncharacterized protein (TIGR02001 family)